MSTPPRVTAASAQAAMRRIFARHADRGDERLDQLGDSAADTLAYLRKHGPARPALLADDLADAALLQVRLWWEHAERERWLFDTAERLRVNRTEFGAVFGLRNRQSFRDRSDRLHQLLDDTGAGRPDEQTARADRAAARADAAWLAAHTADVREIAVACLDLEQFASVEAAEWLQDVRDDLEQGRVTAGACATLQLAVDALDESPGIRAVTAWPRVRDRWASLTRRRGDQVAGGGVFGMTS